MVLHIVFIISKNICHLKFLQCVRINQHSSSLCKNLENSQATFVSSSRFAVEENKEKKVITIAKLFALHANTISEKSDIFVVATNG